MPRLIGFFNVTIANHSMTVIEADGISFLSLTIHVNLSLFYFILGIAHEPYTVNSLPVLPGQRYSVVVSTKLLFRTSGKLNCVE